MAAPAAVSDLQLVAALTRRESQSLADVLEGLAPEQWALPGVGDWTVDQVTGHLGIVPSSIEQWYEAAVAGEEVEPIDLRDPEFQETQLDMIGEADPEDRIAGVRCAYASAADLLAELDPGSLDAPTYTPEGMLPLVIAARISLSELYVHGFDVRRATGLDDRGDPEVAEALLPHSMAVLPSFLAGAGDLASPVAVIAGERSWTVAPAGSGVSVTEGGSGGGTALRIDPPDLVLLVWGRIPLSEALDRGAAIDGDAAAVERLLGHLDPL